MIACLYDVHGNLPALEAVLADAGDAGADVHLLGGDYALFGGWPQETVARLRELPRSIWIRGNGERWTASPQDAPRDPVVQSALAACAEALGADLVAELASLPEAAVVGTARFVHASPVSDVRSFGPEPASDEDELLGGIRERRLVFGHTHLPFSREHGGRELINPGSVGLPFDQDPRAAYALIDGDGNVEHRRVEYDHETAAARVRERFAGAAWTTTVAERLLRARFDVAPPG